MSLATLFGHLFIVGGGHGKSRIDCVSNQLNRSCAAWGSCRVVAAAAGIPPSQHPSHHHLGGRVGCCLRLEAMTTSELAPLPFHRTVVEELQRLEPELWRWFSSAESSTQHEDEVRQELLKSTYRLDVAAHAEVYAAVDRAKEALALTAAVTLYQAQGTADLNASVLPLADEA